MNSSILNIGPNPTFSTLHLAAGTISNPALVIGTNGCGVYSDNNGDFIVTNNGSNFYVMAANGLTIPGFTPIQWGSNAQIVNDNTIDSNNLSLKGGNSTVQTLMISAYGATCSGALKSSTGKLNLAGIPTSSAGLVTGDVWSNLGILTIV